MLVISARGRMVGVAAILGLVTVLAGCGGPGSRPAGRSTSRSGSPPANSPSASPPVTAPDGTVPWRPAHIVVVVFENKPYAAIAGSARAPWLNSVMATGAVYRDSHGVTHPSQPNYLALFSGSTHGVTDDHCPVRLRGRPNLATTLTGAGLTFSGYAEGMPAPGYQGCSSGRYAAKHAPWVDFDTVPAGASQPYRAFPADYARLPSVAMVVPDLCHDMHDCGVATGDAWARANLSGYLGWARTHQSLLLLTFDEDDDTAANRIFTVAAGAGVTPGRYDQRVDHYSVLRAITGCFGLAAPGAAASARPLPGVCSGAGPTRAGG